MFITGLVLAIAAALIHVLIFKMGVKGRKELV